MEIAIIISLSTAFLFEIAAILLNIKLSGPRRKKKE